MDIITQYQLHHRRENVVETSSPCHSRSDADYVSSCSFKDEMTKMRNPSRNINIVEMERL